MTQPSGPVHVPGAAVPIPRNPPISVEAKEFLPSPERDDRKVFRTVFHQNLKYRDFVTGLVPSIGSDTGSSTKFRIVSGTLFRASEHARGENGAALLIIDEINRGPAVQIFGGSIVAIESDKRLASDNSERLDTQSFELIEPQTGDMVEYSLPHHLYILAAMNQADTSVEPLDVAFLRRWTPFRLDPDPSTLRTFYELPPEAIQPLPSHPTVPAEVYEAAVQAWSAVNARIRVGRGPEFQIGHGVMMACAPTQSDLQSALQHTAHAWSLVRAHVDEVFFGDVRGVAYVLNVGAKAEHPYILEDTTFADEPRLELRGPDKINTENVYEVLRAVSD
jgi:5-methylcytosine-specific restriction protein B